MSERSIVVVGGGAAGLMAAGQAAASGDEVLVIEKMKRPGRKLNITGKGRCNITNVAGLDDFTGHFGKNGSFLHQAFAAFFAPELMSFLESRGLKLVTERGGRVFPASGKAMDVTDTLVDWVKGLGVSLKCSSTVSELVIENGRVTAVIAEGQKYPCDAVILAAGGSSYPATGSSGDGCALAKAAGHAIVSLRPALVPLETAGSFARKMDGLGLRNINATLMIDGRKQREAFGEMTFMKTGITGPVILTISGDAVDAVRSGHDVSISVDLKPALNDAKLEARIERDCGKRAGENFGSFLRGFMAKPMVSVCAEGVGIPMKRSVSSLNAEDKKRLKMWLKGFEMKITGYRPFEEAIVTAGGVSVEEVDSASMESKIVKGLFIAGEVLDINADTGGYNLQGAFSTGWLAGRCAAESE